MRCNYSCKSAEHSIARRGFLGGMLGAAGSAASVVGGLGVFTNPAIAKELASQQKRVVVFNICLLYTSPRPRDRTRARMPSSG